MGWLSIRAPQKSAGARPRTPEAVCAWRPPFGSVGPGSQQLVDLGGCRAPHETAVPAPQSALPPHGEEDCQSFETALAFVRLVVEPQQSCVTLFHSSGLCMELAL